MSGFAGVFHLGCPDTSGPQVDRGWLEKMAAFQAFRGPDATQIWVSGSAGLCHTLLRTRAEHDGRPQIATLDDNAWIAGDVRIDDRETLLAKLRLATLPPAPDLKSASSAELVLHAYRAWGEACVEHLLGDFSFVIWDASRRRVFAARDQLGVKPLFYAEVSGARAGKCLLIANTLDCLRQLPVVSSELNEHAIGDFLIAGMNFNFATTFFKGIQRLPVAHRLTATAEGLRTERYWNLPIDQPLYLKRSSDYVDRFHELLRAAVRDRLPDGPLGVFMSGGLDSPAVAAAAVQLGAATTAFTSVYDRLIPDQERYYSGLAARHLGIPIQYNVRDDEPWGWEPGAPPIHTPEPIGDPTSLIATRQYDREIASQARVFFFGDGPDAALLYEWRSHLNYLIRQRRWTRLAGDLALHFRAFKRVPLLPTLPRMWRERMSNQPDWYDASQSLPAWIRPEFAADFRLQERLQEIRTETPSPHPIRPKSYGCFDGHFPMCGGGNDGSNAAAMEGLHPLGDLRLVRFLVAVPAVPWCREKYLIRTALKGVLPEAVRTRPKAPLAGFPYLIRTRASARPVLPVASAVERYVDTNKIPWPGGNRDQLDHGLRVLGLQYWLLGL